MSCVRPVPSALATKMSPAASKVMEPGLARPNGGGSRRCDPTNSATAIAAKISRTARTARVGDGIQLRRLATEVRDPVLGDQPAGSLPCLGDPIEGAVEEPSGDAVRAPPLEIRGELLDRGRGV